MPSETSPSETALSLKTLGDVVTSHTQPKSLVLPETGCSDSVSWRLPLHASLPFTLFMGGYGLHIFFAYMDVSSHHIP